LYYHQSIDQVSDFLTPHPGIMTLNQVPK